MSNSRPRRYSLAVTRLRRRLARLAMSFDDTGAAKTATGKPKAIHPARRLTAAAAAATLITIVLERDATEGYTPTPADVSAALAIELEALAAYGIGEAETLTLAAFMKLGAFMEDGPAEAVARAFGKDLPVDARARRAQGGTDGR